MGDTKNVQKKGKGHARLGSGGARGVRSSIGGISC